MILLIIALHRVAIHPDFGRTFWFSSPLYGLGYNVLLFRHLFGFLTLASLNGKQYKPTVLAVRLLSKYICFFTQPSGAAIERSSGTCQKVRAPQHTCPFAHVLSCLGQGLHGVLQTTFGDLTCAKARGELHARPQPAAQGASGTSAS